MWLISVAVAEEIREADARASIHLQKQQPSLEKYSFTHSV